MAGAGYNIPISASVASTFSVPQTQNAPSYIIFGATGGNIGGDIQQNPSNINPATATSSASEGGNAASASSGSGVSLPSSTWGKVALYGGGGLALLAIGVFIYFKMRKH